MHVPILQTFLFSILSLTYSLCSKFSGSRVHYGGLSVVMYSHNVFFHYYPWWKTTDFRRNGENYTNEKVTGVLQTMFGWRLMYSNTYRRVTERFLWLPMLQ